MFKKGGGHFEQQTKKATRQPGLPSVQDCDDRAWRGCGLLLLHGARAGDLLSWFSGIIGPIAIGYYG